MITLLEKMIALGFVIVLASTALAFGTVEPWSILLFELQITLLMLLWGAKAIVGKEIRFFVPTVVGPLIALWLLGLLQSFSYTGADGVRKSLSLNVDATRGVLLLLTCLVAGALLAGNFLATRERLQWLAKWITIYGLALALFGIVQYLASNGQIYWLRSTSRPTFFGPFFNRNHFAGYLELLLPWPITLALLRSEYKQEILFYSLVAVWLGIAAVVTLSRGGMISLLAELLLLAALSHRLFVEKENDQRKKLWRPQIIAVVSIFIAIVTGSLWISKEQLVRRLTTGQEMGVSSDTPAQSFETSRGEIWRKGWQIFQAHPFFGAGMGAYGVAYTIYTGDNGLNQIDTDYAHNDYLQALTDGGIVGGAIVIWFLVLASRAMGRGLRVKDKTLRAVSLACSAGLVGILVHSIFDFNLQLPSHSLLFVSYLAILDRLSALALEAPPQQLLRPVVMAEEAGTLERSFR